MERSLKFFIDIYKNQGRTSNPDASTGSDTTDITVEKVVTTYNPNNPNETVDTQTKKLTYKLINSNMGDNVYVNYNGNSPANEIQGLVVDDADVSNIDIASVIRWSRKKSKAIRLSPLTFAFHKNFNVYPANRLIILRRFRGPVEHNIFSLNSSPIATLATYYDLDTSPVKITFNEKWKTFNRSFMDVIQDLVGIKFTSIQKIDKALGSVGNSNLSSDLMNLIGQELGIVSDGGMPYGDPNMIYEARIRDVSGEGVTTGLESSVAIEFDATYVMKSIGGVDTRKAMLDILGQIILMGTSSERFYITGSASSTLRQMLKDFADGNFTQLITGVINAITGLMSKITNLFVGNASEETGGGETEAAPESSAAEKKRSVIAEKFTQVVDGIKEMAKTFIKNRFSRYKTQLQGAIAALSGMHTGPWHVMIGNPKFPWFTMGNLIVDKVTLDVGGEMAYNDIFTEINVKISLSPARSMGQKGLSSIFNSGRGRIYDEPAKLKQVTVPANTDVKFAGNPSATEEQASNVETSPEENVAIQDVGNTTDFSNGTISEDTDLTTPGS